MKCVVIICQLRALAALAMGEILSGIKGRRKNVIGAGICVRIRRRRVLVEDENRLRRREDHAYSLYDSSRRSRYQIRAQIMHRR